MKKIFLSFLSVAIVATTATAQTRIAPELGLNLADMSIKFDNGAGNTSTAKTSMRAGLLIGANVEFGLSDNIYLQPGIFYKMTGTNSTEAQKTRISINTLEIPLNAYYKFGKPGGNRFGLGLGIYAGLNLSGKATWSSYTDPSGYVDSAGSHTLKFGSTKFDPINGVEGDDMKMLDMGMSLNASYELSNGLYFHGRYQMGFSNLSLSEDGNIKTRALSVSVGYYLGSNTKKHIAKK